LVCGKYQYHDRYSNLRRLKQGKVTRGIAEKAEVGWYVAYWAMMNHRAIRMPIASPDLLRKNDHLKRSVRGYTG
jgi:hypothetical protein